MLFFKYPIFCSFKGHRYGLALAQALEPAGGGTANPADLCHPPLLLPKWLLLEPFPPRSQSGVCRYPSFTNSSSRDPSISLAPWVPYNALCHCVIGARIEKETDQISDGGALPPPLSDAYECFNIANTLPKHCHIIARSSLRHY